MSIVHVVHCIDTEGPLYEPLQVTFDRIAGIFDLHFEASHKTLTQLQNKEINLNGLEDEVARVLAPQILEYNDNWNKLDKMLRGAMSQEFRNNHKDSFGNGWVYNWHCLDLVGFKDNPRQRELGFHKIFDHFSDIMAQTGSQQDGLHFHHHPIPFSESAHHCATHYFNRKPIIFEILARRIIERQWFPCINRPGFHTTRPDSHWLMEQFIPFDYANQATSEDYSAQKDLANGRYGDWRRAPSSWQPYHPSHDDYQVLGSCRRWIGRCLNIGTRLRLLTQADVDQAFQEAKDGKPVILSFTNHDFRDIRPDVSGVQEMLNSAALRFPDVKFRHCEGREAMRMALQLPPTPPIDFICKLQDRVLHISVSAPTFGPQPFLAIKTKAGEFHHDNLDFQVPQHSWSYTFDEQSIPLESIGTIGLASCDSVGNVTVVTIDPHTSTVTQRHL